MKDIDGSGTAETTDLPKYRILAWPAYKSAFNSYTVLLYDAFDSGRCAVEDWTPMRALLRPADFWHIHFPDALVSVSGRTRALLNVVVFCVLLQCARWRGTRIVWTVHDLDSPEGLHPTLQSWLYRFFTRRVDAVTSLSETGCRGVVERFPVLDGRPCHAIRHGHYRGAYADTLTPAEARRSLGIAPDATVLLLFGRVRAYKGLPELIAAFRALEGENLVLVVAGKPFDHAIEGELRDAAGGDPRIRLFLDLIPDDRVQVFFRAADLALVPYRRILHSGVLMLALSFDCPVLASDVGSLPEYREAAGDRWVRTFSGRLTPDTLGQAAEWVAAGRNGPCDLDGFGWREIAARTCAVFDDLYRRRGG